MTIETKYNVGDKVWVKHTNWPENVVIISIDIQLHINRFNKIEIKNVTYYVEEECKCVYHIYEKGIFPTKEELLKSL